MRLKEIHIYGYGKLNNVQMKNLADFQIFFGENEAGKTTIMSFIQSILFGFPSKQQTSLLRYEPKTGSAYGGKLVIETQKYGEAVIERVRGKAAGDVTVMLHDGTKKDEHFLRELLNGMDRMMFQSIFSFHLEGLQKIGRLREEDIAKYLTAAGTVGTDVLLQAKEQLERELHQLFKPGGRKPPINKQIKELREQEQLLRNAGKESAKYETLVAERESVRRKIAELDEMLHFKKNRLSKCGEWYKMMPLLLEKQEIEKELAKIGTIDFPPEGISRLEKYRDKLMQTSSVLMAAKQKSGECKRRLDENAPMSGFDWKTAEMLVQDWPAYRQTAEKVSEIKRSIDEYKKEYEYILKELNLTREAAESVHELSLGMDLEAKLKEEVRQFVRLEGKVSDSEELLNHELSLLNQWEITCEEIESRLIDEETFQMWKKQYESRESAESAANQKRALEKEIEDLLLQKNRHEKNRKEKRKQTLLLNGLFLSLFAIVFSWSFISGQWMFAVFSLAVVLYAGASMIWRNNDSSFHYEEMIEKKRRQLKDMEENLANARADQDFAVRYEKQQQLREEWKQAYSLLDQQRKKAEHAREQHDQLKKAFLANRENLQNLKKLLGLNEDFLNLKLEDAFHYVKRLQQLKDLIFGLKNQLERVSEEQEKWHAGLKNILHKLGIRGKQPDEAIFLLKDLLEKEKKKEVIFQELQQKLYDLQDEALLYEKEQLEIKRNIAELLREADAESEEAFREKARLFEQREKWLERLRLLKSQIGIHQDLPEYTSLGDVKAEMDALSESIEALHLEQNHCRDRLASLAQEIRFLEEGGTYTEHLHRFYHMRSVFNEEAGKWAQRAVAKSLLDKMIQKYQEERFPKAIQKAEEFFFLLTDGEYRRLHILEDGNLLAEREDRVFFTPAELSKGTGEQLYTAIRLGLVHVLRKEFPFPIVIDDGFVNFDEKRIKRVLQLIRQISAETQVLFFTCHRHIMNQLTKEHAIMLEKNNSFQFELEKDMV